MNERKKHKYAYAIECPLCDADMHIVKNTYWVCEDCPAILMEYVNRGDAHKVADALDAS